MAFYKGFSADMSGLAMFNKKVDGELVKKSMQQIVVTGVGERVMRRDFGCEILKTVFDNMGDFLDEVQADFIRTSIKKFEPRVDVDNITVTSNDTGLVDVVVEHTFNGRVDNTRFPIEKDVI